MKTDTRSSRGGARVRAASSRQTRTRLPHPPTTSTWTDHVRQFAHMELTEAEAYRWAAATHRHRRRLWQSVGRDVGPRVALLDYALNLKDETVHMSIIATRELEHLRKLAVRDALTGLYNRTYFDLALDREAHRSRRSGRTVSLLLFDLDGLKTINDRRGHRAGDRALEAVGRVLTAGVRGGDIACRYGGDEFAVLLDAKPGEARLVAERLVAGVARHPVPMPDDAPLRLAVSVGVATMPTDASSGEQLVQRADKDLYETKRATRVRRCAQ